MRTLLVGFVLTAAAVWSLSHVEIRTASPDPRISSTRAAGWRRTEKGWEKTEEWWRGDPRPAPSAAANVHPVLVAILFAGLAIGALTFFADAPSPKPEARGKKFPRDVRNPRPPATINLRGPS